MRRSRRSRIGGAWVLAFAAHQCLLVATHGPWGVNASSAAGVLSRDDRLLPTPARRALPEMSAEHDDACEWQLPGQEDLAIGGDIERQCMNCGGPQVVQGVSAAKLQGRWVAFFCRHCSPHLSVRNNAQVPVTWTGPAANITGDLTMLPLYKRCRRCRRWATFGTATAGGPASKRHCKMHAPPGERPVHRRACEAQNCTKRPSYAAVGAQLPLRCAAHKLKSDMDICHSRCLHRDKSEGGTTRRCWRVPTYGYKEWREGLSKFGRESRFGGGAAAPGVPQLCWQHKAQGMEKVVTIVCRQPGCSSIALYARPTERKLFYCEAHRRDGDEFQGEHEASRTDTLTPDSCPNPLFNAFFTNISFSSPRTYRPRYALDVDANATLFMPPHASKSPAGDPVVQLQIENE